MAAGIGRMHMMAALAMSAGLAVASPAAGENRGPSSKASPSTEQHRRRAAERRERKRIEADLRERILRQQIAESKDDRPDKYLHAAARRRRAAEAEAVSPRPLSLNGEG